MKKTRKGITPLVSMLGISIGVIGVFTGYSSLFTEVAQFLYTN